ncbi:hypothetical protein [Pseudonocardia acaciae]|uniref:hypothetical protein n=1 Tax=Pseudonocardia acaciae TaxID=551276 RepID=UPI00048CABC9|nr:hypothetical protein [Pseudonocardia acaciae]
MLIHHKRVLISFIGLVAACATLAGCGEGPRQAGSAAIVGSDAVSLSTVQRQVDSVYAKPEVAQRVTQLGGTPADIAQLMVTRDVQHIVYGEAARRDGIVVDEAQVDAELNKPAVAAQLAGQFLIDQESKRDMVRDRIIAKALATKYFDRLIVTVDMVATATRQDAEATARRLAAGGAQADAVLATGDANTALRGLPLRAAAAPTLATEPIFGTPAGQVVASQSTTTGQWTVLRVTDRRFEGPPVTDPNLSAVSRLDDRSLEVIGRRLTQPLSEELGVRINPRYGAWDPVKLMVLPTDQATSMIVKTAGQNP